MFYTLKGSFLRVNCETVPNTDVSGAGVRGALYLQAAVTILLSLFNQSPSDILLSNISLQATSLALVAASYFDSTVDIPHTLIVSYFAVLFSVCRISSYDLLPSSFKSRTALKTLSRLWLLDLFFRTCIVLFNYQIWSALTQFQGDPDICPGGFGFWSFFSMTVDLKVSSPATQFAFVYCILDLAWEGCRYVSGIVRFWYYRTEGLITLKAQLRMDPRYWAIRHVAFPLFRRPLPTTDDDDTLKAYRWISYCQTVRKFLIWLYIIVNIELTIYKNGLKAESSWSFGQIFSMVNMLGMLGMLLGYCIRSGLNPSLTTLVKKVSRNDKVVAGVFIVSISPGMLLAFYLAEKLFPQRVFPRTPNEGLPYVIAIILIWVAFLFLWFGFAITSRRLLRQIPSHYFTTFSSVVKTSYYSISRPFYYAFWDEDETQKVLYSREVDAINKSMLSNPNQRWWIERLARTHERNGDLSAAAGEWQRLADLFPNEWWPQVQLADVLEQQEDLDAAVGVWETILKNTAFVDPCGSWWGSRFESVLWRRGGQREVIEGWKRLVTKHPSDPRFRRGFMNALSNDGGEDAIIRAYRILLVRYPHEREYRIELANAYERKDNVEAAFKTWRKLCEDEPDDTIAESHLVRIYLWLIKHKKISYCECVELRPMKTLEGQNDRICSKCDEYLSGLSPNVLYAIKEGAAAAAREGEEPTPEDAEILVRLVDFL